MMNIYSKYVIIRHIDIHQILINGYLPMNGKYALPCRFSFGEYSDEKLMSIHTANIQIFICKYDSMIVGFKKNRMYIIGGCLQQLIYIACRRKTYMDGNPK